MTRSVTWRLCQVLFHLVRVRWGAVAGLAGCVDGCAEECSWLDFLYAEKAERVVCQRMKSGSISRLETMSLI